MESVPFFDKKRNFGERNLENWFHSKSRKPLIVKGARQIGKTASIKWFAAMHYSNVVEINFVESPGFKKIIEDGYSPVEIIRNITRISPETVFVPGELDAREPS